MFIQFIIIYLIFIFLFLFTGSIKKFDISVTIINVKNDNNIGIYGFTSYNNPAITVEMPFII